MTNTFTYKLCKSKINLGLYETQEDVQIMLDVFYAGNRISLAEYQELTEILTSKQVA